MTHAATNDAVPAPAAGAGRALRRMAPPAAGLAAVWWLLNPGDPASWIVGVPAVAAGAAVALLFPDTPAPRRSLRASLRFAGYFARASVVGATDVALRAMRPSLDLRPGFIIWRTRLPEGVPRELFANAVTLLPGTLSARLEGDALTVHQLDERADPGLSALEARVAAMFRLDLGGAA